MPVYLIIFGSILGRGAYLLSLVGRGPCVYGINRLLQKLWVAFSMANIYCLHWSYS